MQKKKMKTKDKINRKRYHLILTITVIALVILLDAGMILIPDQTSSDMENRTLQTFPKLTVSTLLSGKFESEFETYIADQFPFRNKWITLESTVSRMFGKTESNDIFLAKNGYLIQNFHTPSAEQYTSILEGYKGIAKLTEGTDITLNAMIVPTAVNIYSNKLPWGAVTDDQNSFLSQLQSDLSSSGINWINLTDTFEACDKETQLYYRTDHHWTSDAAFLAYQAYNKALELEDSTTYSKNMISDSFEGTLSASSGMRTSETDEIYAYLPNQVTDYTVSLTAENTKSASVFDTKSLSTRSQYNVFFGGNHPEVVIDSASESHKILMVFKDSYANCFVPFLIPDYAKIIMIDPRYYTEDIAEAIQSNNVTDILFLYNANTAAEDHSLYQLTAQ